MFTFVPSLSPHHIEKWVPKKIGNANDVRFYGLFVQSKPASHISSDKNKDASLEGWGASLGNVSTGGAWLADENLMDINVLELKAILLA